MSSSGPIEVLLISRESKESEPSVVRIPPKESTVTKSTTVVVGSQETRSNSGSREIEVCLMGFLLLQVLYIQIVFEWAVKATI